jgi:hypothetical protein
MRFATVPPAPRKQPESDSAAAQSIRGPVAKQGDSAQAQPHPVKTAELPVDLDQRVRLVGEW